MIDIVILLTDLAPTWSLSIYDREDNSAVIAKVPASKPIAGNLNTLTDMCIWYKVATFDGGKCYHGNSIPRYLLHTCGLPPLFCYILYYICIYCHYI